MLPQTHPVISVADVSKIYRRWPNGTARLAAAAWETMTAAIPQLGPLARRRIALRSSEFHALRNITFSVGRGESLGIVGRNGSGKSTLLQIIARTLQPTSGQVHVHGRVAALLELGSGFNPEFTGRENIYLTGAILGLTHTEIEDRFDGIAAFADIGSFLDQPVKTYSSGMVVRLAFATQTAIAPEVFIVDEALAVGDAPFQVKCFRRIRQILDTGTTVIFVSHDLNSVRTFCQRAIWLHEGRIMDQGAIKAVCDAYERSCWRAAGMETGEVGPIRGGDPSPEPSALHPWLSEDRRPFLSCIALGRHGSGRARLLNFFLADASGRRITACRHDETVHLCYVLQLDELVPGPFQIGATIKTKQGVALLSISDRFHALRLPPTAGSTLCLSLACQLPLRSGDYHITTGIFSFPEDARYVTGAYDFSRAEVLDRLECAGTFSILPQTEQGIYGPVHVEGALRVVASSPSA